MENRTTAIIATVASVLLCGLPGLCLCLFGALTAAGVMQGSTTLNGVTNNTGTVPQGYGVPMLCLAVILVIIPIAVGFFTFRKRSAAVVVPPPPPDNPIPPAI